MTVLVDHPRRCLDSWAWAWALRPRHRPYVLHPTALVLRPKPLPWGETSGRVGVVTLNQNLIFSVVFVGTPTSSGGRWSSCRGTRGLITSFETPGLVGSPDITHRAPRSFLFRQWKWSGHRGARAWVREVRTEIRAWIIQSLDIRDLSHPSFLSLFTDGNAPGTQAPIL